MSNSNKFNWWIYFISYDINRVFCCYICSIDVYLIFIPSGSRKENYLYIKKK